MITWRIGISYTNKDIALDVHADTASDIHYTQHRQPENKTDNKQKHLRIVFWLVDIKHCWRISNGCWRQLRDHQKNNNNKKTLHNNQKLNNVPLTPIQSKDELCNWQASGHWIFECFCVVISLLHWLTSEIVQCCCVQIFSISQQWIWTNWINLKWMGRFIPCWMWHAFSGWLCGPPTRNSLR